MVDFLKCNHEDVDDRQFKELQKKFPKLLFASDLEQLEREGEDAAIQDYYKFMMACNEKHSESLEDGTGDVESIFGFSPEEFDRSYYDVIGFANESLDELNLDEKIRAREEFEYQQSMECEDCYA